jgi:hypothetical protein
MLAYGWGDATNMPVLGKSTTVVWNRQDGPREEVADETPGPSHDAFTSTLPIDNLSYPAGTESSFAGDPKGPKPPQ